MRTLVTLAILLSLAAAGLQAQPAIVAKFVPRSHSFQGTTLPYRLFIPDPYNPADRYPVVLALHGSGERGSDNLSQIQNWRLATSWADPVNQAKYPCFVVAPQCPVGGEWSNATPELATANDILDSLAREFSIDTNRIYVTGLSMGGYGTWDLIVRFPERFAAAIPMSGGGDVGSVHLGIGVPIWDFHGALDPAVPVGNSRELIGALHDLGRPVIYTHCYNRDCYGLPDSLIAMAVKSHEDLFYTEYRLGQHIIWNESYDYPYLFPWVFDKYRKRAGAITLSNLKSHRTLVGTEPITWSPASSGDSVEIWFSPDAGTRWQLISRSEQNTGTYLWNTGTVNDCPFGQLTLFVKDSGGHIKGTDRSGFFAINNSAYGTPFVRIINDAFSFGGVYTSDSLDIPLLIGDSKSSPLAAAILYSPDGGISFAPVDTYTAAPDTLVQTRRIGIAASANSNRAVLKAVVTDNGAVSSSVSSPFTKQSARTPGPTAHHSGEGGGSVTVHVVNQNALLHGEHYRVTFDDTSFTFKVYNVRDVDRGADVVRHATELDGVTEGPLFDGMRLLVHDVPSAVVNPDSTRWEKGSATMHVTVYMPEFLVGPDIMRGYPYPFDYRLTLSDAIVDTSKAVFGFDATPMKFTVWNITKNRKAEVTFSDADGNNAIGSFDEVDILEPDGAGLPRLSWGMFFLAEAGDTLPVPGDQFLLKTLKPLSVADVYEFTSAVTSVATGEVPPAFELDQNFPNPFNPSTTIRYSVPRATYVSLTVFNILGQRVATLVDGMEGAGYHQARFDGRMWASGVYFYRLTAGNFTQTKKSLLVR